MEKKRIICILLMITLCVTAVYALKVISPYRINHETTITTSAGIYAEMFYHNHTETELEFVEGVEYILFMYNNSMVGFTYQGGFMVPSNLTALNTGIYKVTYMSSGSGQNNHIYFSSIFVNGIDKPNCESHHKMAAGDDVITQTGHCLVRLDSGDVVDLRVTDATGDGVGKYWGSNLVLIRVGD